MSVPAQVLRGGGARRAGHGGVARGGALRLPPAWAIAAALALAYVIAAPPSSDLAAASYRSDLLSRVGFTLWDNSWYGGHHLLAYSLLAPALGALVGPQIVAALSMTLATALFAALIDGHFTARATRAAAVVFALGASIELLSNRVPFDLGLAIALGALLLAQRGRPALALVLAVLSSLASPVAGAFLALAFLAWALSGPERAWPAALTLAALTPIGLLELVFPEGGTQPFAGSAFYPALAGVLAITLLIPREQRALRVGVLLYALAMTGAFVLANGRRQQRRPARRAARGTSRRLPAARRVEHRPAPAPAARARSAAAVLAGQRVGQRLPRRAERPGRERLLLHAAARRAEAARRRIRKPTHPAGAHRGGRHHRPLGGALAGPACDARPRLGAPARQAT